MSEDPGGAEAGGLQFDKVEVGQRSLCARCTRAIDGEYYAIRGALICPQCNKLLGGSKAGSGAGGMMRAIGYGLGAAIVGTIIWLLVQKLFKGQYGLVAIGVGYLVGMAVRTGSGGRGGRRYQVLAMALTYFSIASSYVPDVVSGVREQVAEQRHDHAEPKPPPDGSPLHLVYRGLAWIFVFGIAMAVPFLAKDLIGFVIIGIALYEAWKINVAPPISGPFRIATPPT